MSNENQNIENTQIPNDGSKNSSRNSLIISASILITGILIAAAVFYAGDKNDNRVGSIEGSTAAGVSFSAPTPVPGVSIRPVSAEDHTRGDINAPVKIVEFSDLECPFCKRFHPSLQLVMDEYGESGDVAWVYRHFPLDSIHSKARKEAQATECANEIGGNDAFWKYLDRLYEITPSNNNLDLSLLPQIADEIGLNRGEFAECLNGDARGGKYAERIEADYQEAVASGGTGTPWSIIIASNGKTFPLSGAQSYTALKALVKLALEEK